MLNFNKDVLIIILEKLKDDNASLFSCLLVNRLWCNIIVPNLWSNPWKFLLLKTSLERNKLFFNIILLHLSETSRNLLINEGINIIPTGQKNPLFDYVSFCKYLNHIPYYIFNLNKAQNLLLEQEIYKLFIGKCSAIKYLYSNGIHPIDQFPGANTCFSKLNELVCSTVNPSFFYGMAKICSSIEKVSIDLLNDDPGLAELIEMQKQIKYIEIFFNNYENHKREMNGKNKYNRVSQALNKHTNSILNLKLWIDETIQFFSFLKLINLQTLELVYKDIFLRKSELEKQLTMAALEERLITMVFPNLQVLKLSNIPFSIAAKIIQNTNGNLWMVRITNTYYDNTREYINVICKSCPNIRYVTIFVNNQNLDDLGKLLIGCHHLEGIDVLTNGTFNGDKFLDLLVRLAPISLYKIKINLWIFIIESLNFFLNNWKGQKPLCLYLLKNNSIPKDIFDLVGKHKVKIIERHNCGNFWDVDNHTEITWID